ncbi:MAG: sulfatase-like hydrolase/transferase [bacterium]|nr:sulfatase-like hydrolase/transferase [bacterium]
MDRPNILIMYTDQQRWDALGASGNPHIRTPHLDRLAEGGCLFENAFCNNPVCMPSRQSMLSGRYPSVLGATTNGVEMDPDMPTLMTILRPYGYHTANLGKLHFKNHSNRDHREPHPAYGFDTLILSDEPGCYDDAYIKWVAEHDPAMVEKCRCAVPPAWQGPPVKAHGRETTEPYVFEGPEELTHTAFVAEETIGFLRRHQGDRFFAIAGFYAPHAPINPPARFVDWYDPATMPLPKRNPGEDRYHLTDDQWRQVKAYYYALVSHIDDQVGRILTALDELGLRERTIVIFTADHGEHLGDHGITAKGPFGYDSCVHVPLIVSWPGRVAAGGRRTELVEAVDLAPMILDFCGVQIPPFMQGASVRPLLGEAGAPRPYKPRRSVFIEFRTPFGRSYKTIRTHDYKYCATNGAEEWLFDLREDPDELRNLARDPARSDLLTEARAELLRRWFDVENQYPRLTGAY